jgi:hypothetical protein
MLHREKPKQVEPQPQVEEMKFGRGGGDDKPHIRFGMSTFSSSQICQPDPENPGNIICKKTVNESSLDPETGKRM